MSGCQTRVTDGRGPQTRSPGVDTRPAARRTNRELPLTVFNRTV
jgi:hypothetical protein